MPQYAVEGGKLYLAEALFSEFKYIIRCPRCVGIPGKPGFNLDSAGKSDILGLPRRAWACTWSNSSKARRTGQPRCQRVQVNDLIHLAREAVPKSAFEAVVDRVCQRPTLDEEQRSVLRSYIIIPTLLQPTLSSQLAPLLSSSPSQPSTIVRSYSSTTSPTSSVSSIEDTAKPPSSPVCTPTTSHLIIYGTPVRPRHYKRAASDSSIDLAETKKVKFESLSAISQRWKEQQEKVDDDNNDLPPQRLATNNTHSIPDSSIPSSGLSTSPTLRIIQVQRQTEAQPRQRITSRPRKKCPNLHQSPAFKSLRRFFQVNTPSKR